MAGARLHRLNAPLVRLMLADSAQVHQGKLFALGAGVGVFPPTPPNSAATLAICGIVVVPWEEANKPHELVVTLVDLDDQPYRVPGPAGEADFRIQAGFSTAPRPELRRGSVLIVPLALQFLMPLRLGDYRFKVSLDGTDLPDAALPLYVIAPLG